MIDAIIGFSVVSFMIFLPRILVELFKNAGCEVVMCAVEADREAAQLCLEYGY